MGGRTARGSTSASDDANAALELFQPATRAWFAGSFASPTAAQAGAWRAIAAGHHTLVVAPTGSGKTLAAFGWAIDQLSNTPLPPADQRCRVLYISPLKALASDVERNLRAPLVGITHAATRLGLTEHRAADLRVGIRTGDTPAKERRDLVRHPPDILITTPESLYLLFTSAARETLTSVTTVILDEVHAVAGTKRGAHLALSLERLDARLAQPAQRIGLSATVHPVDAVATWMAGNPAATRIAPSRAIDIVQPPLEKKWDLQVVVPVEDLGDLASNPSPVTTANAAEPDDYLSGQTEQGDTNSIWPHIGTRLAELINDHHSTLVFTNSRRLSERLTARLNETAQSHVVQNETTPTGEPTPRPPAVNPGQSGTTAGAPAVLARAHHGSVSKEHRTDIESELKAGRLPAVVATSSLELGIDMGAVDAVACVGCPPSVASGLQRVGRAGHQVGATSLGVMFPTHRADLVATTVLTQQMRAGIMEPLVVPRHPLDVLAQQIVAMVAMDDWSVPELLACVRRATSYADLSSDLLASVLDMLSGRYPSTQFAELRPRIVWDRAADVVSARPGAGRLAVTNAGTIPDRGLYGVFLATGEESASGRKGSRRVGELDEEMVYESRVGDVFTLGTSSWRIVDITHDQVLVVPAPGEPGRLPFWHGESVGRPAEFGHAIGRFLRDATRCTPAQLREHTQLIGLDDQAHHNLAVYLSEQQEAVGALATDDTLVIEKFRDELGDWRVVVHSPWGSRVHAPWALVVGARLHERLGIDAQVMAADDGLVMRLPDVGTNDDWADDLVELLQLDPETAPAAVTDAVGGSALFAARFRECAARALLLPRKQPGRRQPLWQQRQRAAQLLSVVSQYPQFPMVLETMRECLHEVFDLPALQQVLRQLRDHTIRVVQVETPTPSPAARSLLFGYVAQFVYESDSPLAERRAAALTLDPHLLAQLLGTTADITVADLLDPEVVDLTQQRLQHTAPGYRLHGLEGMADLLRLLGPLSDAELAHRLCRHQGTHTDHDEIAALSQVTQWRAELVTTRRALEIRLGDRVLLAAIEDAALLRDALGVALPMGIAAAHLEPIESKQPLADLALRYARTHVPFTAAQLAAYLHLGPAIMTPVLRELVNTGQLRHGTLLPAACREVTLPQPTPVASDYCDPEVLDQLRRRTLANARAAIEPVDAATLARFTTSWQHLRQPTRGRHGLWQVLEQLTGSPLTASDLETLVLPARVSHYQSAWLDELLTSGELVWVGRGTAGAHDGWLSLYPSDVVGLLVPTPDTATLRTPVHHAICEVLTDHGGLFYGQLHSQVLGRIAAKDATGVGNTESPIDVATALWDCVWGGWVTNDSFAAVRGFTAHQSHRRSTSRRIRPARPRFPSGLSSLRALARTAANDAQHASTGIGATSSPVPAQLSGRWSLTPAPWGDAAVRTRATADVLLQRYAIVTRGVVSSEDIPGGFAPIYQVLAALEDAGQTRRGYFVEHLGAAQFATTSAINLLRDQLPHDQMQHERSAAPSGSDHAAVVLAASDPAQVYGAAVEWSPLPGEQNHRPGRKAGAAVVLVDGELVWYCERGGKSLLSWSSDQTTLAQAATALTQAVRTGRLRRLALQRIDGTPALTALTQQHPSSTALVAAGFTTTPQGLRAPAPPS